MTTTSLGSETQKLRPRLLPWLLTGGIFALAAGLLYRGLDFYELELEQRVEHADFRVLGPGGMWGHGYGIVGTALILTNLLYLLRRRFARLPVGSMKAWLDMHAFTGLAGGMLILFHSAFQARTDIALVSAISLGVVVLTGVLGRFLHFLAPAPDPTLIATNVHALEAIIKGSGARVRAALDAIEPTAVDAHASLLRTLATVPRWLSEARGARASVLRAAEHEAPIGDPAMETVYRQTSRRLARLAGREVRAVALTAVLRSWRSVHRLLAILMVLTVPAHIVVAWLYGYRWIWSDAP